MDRPIDIISFTVPFPPNYGGIIDVYYRLRALIDQGANVRLHCFTYGTHRPHSALSDLCPVSYYPRSLRFSHHLGKMPFIVSTRKHPDLLTAIASGEGPILFEGLHTCGWIAAQEIAHRPRAVRMHNIESQYYRHLAEESKGFNAFYFHRESRKLGHFEQWAMKHAGLLLPISEQETAYFEKKHNHVRLLPAFHPYSDIEIQEGTGEYVLVQGDLSITHNLKILTTLAPICNRLGVRCVAAGRSPSREGRALLSAYENIEMYTDLPQDEMDHLMHDAQVHVVDAGNTAGFKLKLLASLFTARHVIAHTCLLDDELKQVAHPFITPQDIEHALTKIFTIPADPEHIALRKSVLLPRFSNPHNARCLIDELNHLS